MTPNPSIVFFDTCVLSAYLGLNPKEDEEHTLAVRLVNQLKGKKVEIFLPIPVIQELLICVENLDEREKLYKGIAKYFRIADYSIHAAQHLLSLLDLSKMKEYCQDGSTRDHIRTDVQIISIALVNDAGCIYSSDPHFKKIADGKIEIINYLDGVMQKEFTFFEESSN